MKSIRTDPTVHGARGDERIRTAVCDGANDSLYVVVLTTQDPLSILTGTVYYRVKAASSRKAVNCAKRDYNRRCAPKRAVSGRAAVARAGADHMSDTNAPPRLTVCETCGKPLAAHCKRHWVSGPHCPGECKKEDGKTWAQA